MKTLGLIGGTTWLSTIDYYTYINRGINERLGGFSSAKCILYSVDFGEVFRNNERDDWDDNLRIFTEAALKLETAGAEALVLCANTAHILADGLEKRINIPIIHIVSETAREINRLGLRKAALLGTSFTMERDFYRQKLKEFGIEAVVPGAEDRKFIHTCIFSELGKNIFKPETKQRMLEIIEKLASEGAECVILGCTEIPLIIKQSDLSMPALDTTQIHAKAAVDFALSE